MKKIYLMLFTLLAFVVVLSACGGSASETEGDNSGSSSGSDDTEETKEDTEATDEYADYPEKPIEFIIQYGAGGATDSVYRPVLKKIEEELGGTIVVKNITEGGGIQGAKAIADAEPDGYTAGVLSAGQTVMAPLFREVPVSLEDYEVAGSVGAYLYGIIAPPDAPYDDFEGFIKYLEENSGNLVASTIPSNVFEIFYSWLRNNYDIEFSTIPFDSAADTSLAVQDGSADFSVGLTSIDNARIESGDIKFIAPLGDTRWPVASDVPTLQEQGYEDVNVATILGVGFPKGTPEAITEKWEEALKVALEDPEVVETLENLSTVPTFKTGTDFSNYLNDLDSAFKKMLDRE